MEIKTKPIKTTNLKPNKNKINKTQTQQIKFKPIFRKSGFDFCV